MLNYTCDVCGGPMPDKYIRPKSYPGKLATQCRVYEVCPACEEAGRGVDIREVLLAAWRAAPRAAPAGEAPPPEPEEMELREHSFKGDALRREKREIVERLRAWREAHGMGCLQAVAERTRGAVTDDMLRDLLGDGLKLSIADYRRIGRALDKLEGAGDE